MARQEVLKNQFRLLGSLSSKNSVGNASLATPVDDRGPVRKTNGVIDKGSFNESANTGLARAKAVDLNFLRYYGPYLEVCNNGVIKDKGITSGDACSESTTGYAIDATQLAPVGDLVAGEANGKKSDFYKNSTSLNSTFPAYFEYLAPVAGLPVFGN
jgi:hypothetical protein